MEIELENIGDASAVAPYRIILFLSTDANVPDENIVVARNNQFHEDIIFSNGSWPPFSNAAGQWNGGSLPGEEILAGESMVFTTEGIVFPTNLPNCSNDGQAAFQFGVYIDYNKQVEESNENNNKDFRTILAKCRPSTTK